MLISQCLYLLSTSHAPTVSVLRSKSVEDNRQVYLNPFYTDSLERYTSTSRIFVSICIVVIYLSRTILYVLTDPLNNCPFQ